MSGASNPAVAKLVLASTSPYRRELLQRLGVSFETCAPHIDECLRDGETPADLVVRLAEAKARAAAEQFPEALIIGSDQAAVCGESVLGKPGDYENARRQLSELSGRRVSFLTGLCLLDAARDTTRVALVPYHVEFRKLDAQRIERYLRAEQPYNCSGSIKSEGLGVALFERMEGDDPTALIGLPLIQLSAWLNEAGMQIP